MLRKLGRIFDYFEFLPFTNERLGGGLLFRDIFRQRHSRRLQNSRVFFLLRCPILYFLLNSRTVNETEIICIHNYFTQLYVVSEDDVQHLKRCFLRFSTWLTFSRLSRRLKDVHFRRLRSHLQIENWMNVILCKLACDLMHVSRNDNCTGPLAMFLFPGWVAWFQPRRRSEFEIFKVCQP